VFPVRSEPSWCVIVDRCLRAWAPLGCLVCFRCSLFCCEQRSGFATAPERSCFAGLGIVRIAAMATRVALVYGGGTGMATAQSTIPGCTVVSGPTHCTQTPIRRRTTTVADLFISGSRLFKGKSTILHSEVGR
jgi:hypothetical protein